MKFLKGTIGEIIYYIEIFIKVHKYDSEKFAYLEGKKEWYTLKIFRGEDNISSLKIKNFLKQKKKFKFYFSYNSLYKILKTIKDKYFFFHKIKKNIYFISEKIFFLIETSKRPKILNTFLLKKKLPSLNLNILKKKLKSVYFILKKNNFSNGILFSYKDCYLNFYTSDNYRIAWNKIKLNTKTEGEFFVKKEIIDILLKCKDEYINIHIGKNNICFLTKGMKILSKISGKGIINFSSIINYKTKYDFLLKKNQFINSLLRLKSISKNNQVVLTFKKNNLKLHPYLEEKKFTEIIKIDNLKKIKIKLNVVFLFEAIINFDENIIFKYDGNMVILISGEYSYFLMTIEI
ncbi:hypothetical protein [Candidatus Vidania fulgoroideorum]